MTKRQASLDPAEYAQFLRLVALHQAHAAGKVFHTIVVAPIELHRKRPEKVLIDRKQKRFTAFGETLTLREWSAKRGIPYNALYHRLHKLAWPVDKALTVPIRERGMRNDPSKARMPPKGHPWGPDKQMKVKKATRAAEQVEDGLAVARLYAP